MTRHTLFTWLGKENFFWKTNLEFVFKNLKKMYRQYKDYIKVDLLMYGVLILSVVLYFIWTTLTR